MDFLMRDSKTGRLFVATKEEVTEMLETPLENVVEIFYSKVWGYSDDVELEEMIDKLIRINKNKLDMKLVMYKDDDVVKISCNKETLSKFKDEYAKGEVFIWHLELEDNNSFKLLRDTYSKQELKLQRAFDELFDGGKKKSLRVTSFLGMPMIGFLTE